MKKNYKLEFTTKTFLKLFKNIVKINFTKYQEEKNNKTLKKKLIFLNEIEK